MEGLALLSFQGIFGSKPVLGHVTQTSVHLRKRITYRNSFQNMFSGAMRPDIGGTVITGNFSMNRFVMVTMAIWFCGVVGFGGFISVTTTAGFLSSSGPRGGNDWLAVVIPVGMVIFGVALVGIGRHLARHEAQFITAFLTQTLDATPKTRNAISALQGGTAPTDAELG